MEFVESGDEPGARAFLAEHINEFPEEVRNEIVLTFFEEALENKAQEIEAIGEVQEAALKELESLDEDEKVLEDAQKATQIREELGA